VSTQDWLSMQGDITSVIADLGGTATINRQNSNVSWTTPCVLVSDEFADSVSTGGGVYITQRTVTAFVGNTKDLPSPGDQLVFGPQTFNIKTVIQYMPDGVTNICWQLGLTV
jgi:hypothetical protein